MDAGSECAGSPNSGGSQLEQEQEEQRKYQRQMTLPPPRVRNYGFCDEFMMQRFKVGGGRGCAGCLRSSSRLSVTHELAPACGWQHTHTHTHTHRGQVEACKLAEKHQRGTCPFAHPGDSTQRRPPHTYQALLCPEVRAVSTLWRPSIPLLVGQPVRDLAAR
jgi:hypothetical protein